METRDHVTDVLVLTLSKLGYNVKQPHLIINNSSIGFTAFREKEEKAPPKSPPQHIKDSLDRLGDLFHSISELNDMRLVHNDNEQQFYEDTKPKEKETIPEAGAQSFLVLNEQSKKYTLIGADNIHHAENKATKLFGIGWNTIKFGYQIADVMKCYSFLPVKQFNQLLALLRP